MRSMTTENSFDIIISTCDKFSDLWDANILLLEKNWKCRNGQTFLVTDAPTEKSYENVQIIAAGEGTEITQRLAAAMEKVQTKYILFTLDDYFLTEPIDNLQLLNAVEFMEQEHVDYLRLYPASRHYLKREGAVISQRHPGFYHRDIKKGDYKVSLYPGLWRTDFMRSTLNAPMNVWQYEVELTNMARKYGARCAISNNREFPFLDVIRKGKVLRRAHRYFQENPIYVSGRKVMRARDEWLIAFRTFLRHWLPEPLFLAARNVMKQSGMSFYSDSVPDGDGIKQKDDYEEKT